MQGIETEGAEEPVGKKDSAARAVVYEHTPKVRAQFDEALSSEIGNVCAAVDEALRISWEVDEMLLGLPADEKFQAAYSLGACRKAINDILGCVESLRSGYLDHAQALLRMVDEGFATAVMVAHNKDIYKTYAEGRYSVNESVQKMRQQWKELGIPEDLALKFEDGYKGRHKSAHPTFASIGLNFDFVGKSLPLGGVFLKANIGFYRTTLKNLEVSAKNISGFLQAKLLQR